MELRRTTTMMRTPIPLRVSSTRGAINAAASASARSKSPIVAAISSLSAVFIIIADSVATPPPHRNIASFVVHGSGSQRSIRWRKPTTITRATRDSRVVFTKDVTLEDSGARPKIMMPMVPSTPIVVMTTSNQGKECAGLGGCQTGATSSGAGAETPSVESIVALLILLRR